MTDLNKELSEQELNKVSGGVKTVTRAHADETPKETVTLEYGALQVAYSR